MGLDRKNGIRKDVAEPCKMVIQVRICTPRYLATKELGMEKLRIGWGIRAKRYEDRIKSGAAKNIAKKCLFEKSKQGRKDLYSKEREYYFNRSEWEVETIEAWEGGKEELEFELVRRRIY